MKFSISGTKTPSHEVFSFGMVTSKGLNVRTWAGAENDLCKTVGPLSQGDVVGICDKIEDSKGKPWFYVKIGSKFGFVSAGYVYRMSARSYRFMCNLQRYDKYIKAHNNSFEYVYTASTISFDAACYDILHGEKADMNCVCPTRWSLRDVGLSCPGFYGKDGHFKGITSDMKKHLTLIKSGGPVGKTVEQSVEKGLLKPCDIVCFEDKTHTFSYTGKKCLCWDGGRAAIKNGKYTGIVADYAVANKNRKISEILRWK